MFTIEIKIGTPTEGYGKNMGTFGKFKLLSFARRVLEDRGWLNNKKGDKTYWLPRDGKGHLWAKIVPLRKVQSLQRLPKAR